MTSQKKGQTWWAIINSWWFIVKRPRNGGMSENEQLSIMYKPQRGVCLTNTNFCTLPLSLTLPKWDDKKRIRCVNSWLSISSRTFDKSYHYHVIEPSDSSSMVWTWVTGRIIKKKKKKESYKAISDSYLIRFTLITN